MDDPHIGAVESLGGGTAEDRLDSWKRIATYLKRDVTTVQRWERREAMPVHRHQHEKAGSVYAYRTELDAWWVSRAARLTASEPNEGSAVPADDLPAAPSTASGRRSRAVLPLLIVGAVVLLAVAVYGYLRDADFFWRDPLSDAKVTRLTDFVGASQQAAAISRDGRFVAFLADQTGHLDAWFTEIGSNRYRNLTQGQLRELSNPSIRPVSFSPDGSMVTIWTRRGDGSQPGDINLMGAPTAGGPLQLYMPEAAELDWSPDGTRQVFHTTAPGDPMFVRAAGDASARQIYVAPRGVHCHFPTWSPDGAFIYFVRGEPPSANWDVWRLRANGTGLERLSFHHAWVGYPVLLDPYTLAYLASDADGSGPWLYVMDVRQRRAHRVSFGLERYTSLAASANGARLVATVSNGQSGLWRVAISNSGSPQTRAEAVAPASQSATAPRFGPDYIAYVSSSGGRRGVWKLARGTATELWADTAIDRVGAPAITPDGRHIAFTVEAHGATQLHVIDSGGAHPSVIATPFPVQGDLAWNPDSQSIIAALAHDGEPRLTKIFLDGSPPQSMAAEYSVDPVWSPDGKYFVYSGADVGTTFALRASGPDGRPYGMPNLIMTRGARRVAFLPNSGSLVILRGAISHKNFWLLDLKSGAERQLTDLPANFGIGDFDISADGKEIIFDNAQDNGSSIALIERAHR